MLKVVQTKNVLTFKNFIFLFELLRLVTCSKLFRNTKRMFNCYIFDSTFDFTLRFILFSHSVFVKPNG